MRALTLAFALLITPAAFAQSEPAWKIWLRQGERIVRTQGPRIQRQVMTEAGKIDLTESWNFLQEMWKVRGSLMLDPETILQCCGVDEGWIARIRRTLAQSG
ncbi:hypothetical protein BH11ARM2_BH11ARM2_36020 [soil metagenome]